ncbi:MAG: SAM-dependent chlorinase/fluorinase [Chitinophagaceae bacterium]|nr:SAM-dependent chlorinase/fluorinase [Chitinophagaceae bacterium]
MPILTLTTDIGQRDYLVGAVKGQFLSLLPTLNIADITHYLSQANFPQAAYTCSNAFRYYPSGAYHVVIVNLYDAPARQLLVARHNEQFIICPDNGLLTMITGQKPWELVSIAVSDQHTLLELTQLIAKAVAAIDSTGNLLAAGQPADQIVEKYPLRATVGPNWMEGQILFIDHFENVVINITRNEFEEQRKGRRFRIMFKRNETIDTISSDYSAVPEAEIMAWFNSAGYLELAIRNGNMAGLFGLQGYNEQMQQAAGGMDNKLFYQTVRVFFE